MSVVTQVNHSSLIGLDAAFLRKPRFKGSVFNVGIAHNYLGSQQGARCIVKWPRTSQDCDRDDHLLRMAVTVVDMAAKVVYQFQQQFDLGPWRIVINKPRIIQSQLDGVPLHALMEPYIPGFRKFNSNSGWALRSKRTYNRILQALSHFSYVLSNRQLVLCDLQGGVDEENKIIVLTDPAIVTFKGKQFGCADTGRKGMRNFFHHHECNHLCQHLPMPHDKKLFFRPVEQTTLAE